MNSQLVRVQVYVNPDNLSKVDELVKEIKITRSQIIRDALDAVVIRYIKTKHLLKPIKNKKNALIAMSGVGISKTGKVGLNIDEIYLHD